MGFVYGLVICLCFGVSMGNGETYRAAVVRGLKYDSDLNKHIPIIYEAAKAKVDVLVLPAPHVSWASTLENCCGLDNYDELVNALSEASKAGGLYVVAHLLEKTRCQSRNELIRSNLVFDREGNVVSVYRKPVNEIANCTYSPTEISTFTTDFGVTFGVLMEEDLVFRKPEDLKDLKNFVLTGAWSSQIPFLSATRFASSWAFVNRANLISTAGIFAGKSGIKTGNSNLEIADLNKNYKIESPIVPPVVTSLNSLPTEDLSLYIIRPLDLAASTKGHSETVCHGNFCCDFYIKTKFSAKPDDVNYGLAVFNGKRALGARDIGARTCGVFTCAGLYKRSCAIGSDYNNTNVEFEKISMTGNFTSENTEYPIILTSGSVITSKQFSFESSSNKNSKKVTLEVSNVKNILNFGIFSRDYSRDVKRQQEFKDVNTPGYIISGDMDEFFDYVWIRLRILIFLVSIYVLEML